MKKSEIKEEISKSAAQKQVTQALRAEIHDTLSKLANIFDLTISSWLVEPRTFSNTKIVTLHLNVAFASRSEHIPKCFDRLPVRYLGLSQQEILITALKDLSDSSAKYEQMIVNTARMYKCMSKDVQMRLEHIRDIVAKHIPGARLEIYKGMENHLAYDYVNVSAYNCTPLLTNYFRTMPIKLLAMSAEEVERELIALIEKDKELKVKNLRKQALSKLTYEEARALGITETE